MTYRQAAEILLRKKAGGDIPDDFPVKEEEVFFIMSQIAPLLIKKDFFETFNLDKSTIDPTVFTTITSKVYKSDAGGESYVVLPNAPLMLLGNMIPQVSYIEDRFVTFTYIDASRLNNYKELGILNELDGFAYTYEYVQDCDTEHRLVFFNLEDCVKKLRIRLVQFIDFENFNPDTQIPIKPELTYLLIDEAYKFFFAPDGAQEDKIMDNRKNTNPA